MAALRTTLVLGAVVVFVLLTLADEGLGKKSARKDSRPNKGKEPCSKGVSGARCRKVCSAEEGSGGHCNRRGECVCSGSYKGKNKGNATASRASRASAASATAPGIASSPAMDRGDTTPSSSSPQRTTAT